MKLAVIGSGGRDHAICYKLKQSPKIKSLICIPGNAGTEKIAKNIKEDISNFEALYHIIKQQKIDLVIIGPEQPLVNGLVDFLNKGFPLNPPERFFAFDIKEFGRSMVVLLIIKPSIPLARLINAISLNC